MPMKGHLAPGESEQIEFIYHSTKESKHELLACCTIEGGPEYEMKLIGESSHIEYALNRYSLDFGTVAFNSITP